MAGRVRVAQTSAGAGTGRDGGREAEGDGGGVSGYIALSGRNGHWQEKQITDEVVSRVPSRPGELDGRTGRGPRRCAGGDV